MNLYNLIIEHNSRHTDDLFTYKSEDELEVGDVVYVPFGKGNKELRAYVVEKVVDSSISFDRIKEITRIDSNLKLNGEIINTVLWMKNRYGFKYLDGIRAFVPKGKPAQKGKEKKPLLKAEEEVIKIDKLTREQHLACQTIFSKMEEGKQENFLIHGVTGSGKTEVYMQVIKKALEQGKTAIMLVPEITLTKQILERFIGRFGRENLAIMHSKLTARERYDEWQRIRSGEAKVVVGARMAVFAPLENIGVIILDEEHESTYKSDQTPKYDTVDIALKRLMYYNGILILGSATPSVVSYYRVEKGIYNLIELKERYHNGKMPDISLVDMRKELREGNTSIFSGQLYDEINKALGRKEQVILFLNRRGYSTFISCRECGEALKCEDCGITLTYHKKENKAVCHYCGKSIPLPRECPACKSKAIKYFGVGTEQVEEVTRQLFPEAVVQRLDLDTGKNQREINKIVNDFAKGKTDILIGTQLVAKGLDFKNVSLVGVIIADGTLNIPDFRSAERTFQLVTQVAGRAGRGTKEGKVIVQTYCPDHFALQKASNYDYKGLYEEEISIRNLLNYPPFSDLILVEFIGDDKGGTKKVAEMCYYALIEKGFPNQAENIFMPKEAMFTFGKDKVRYYLLIKSPKELRNQFVFWLMKYKEAMTKNNSQVIAVVDVNPYSIV